MDPLPVVRMPIPTPFAVGDVNVYVLRAEPLTIIDTGTATIDAENALKLAFAREGLFLEALRRIVVTHAHPDHYGLAPRLVELSGAEVLVGEGEIEKVRSGAMWWELGRVLVEAGMPYEVLMEMAARAPEARRMHPRLEGAGALAEGDRIEFEGFSLEVGMFPGHTGGHICLYESGSGTLFAGDTLLPAITPNPILEPDPEAPGGRRRSLVQYLESLARLEAMDLQIVYPGHGEPISDPPALLRSYRRHHVRRADRIASMLDAGGKTAFQIATQMYPDRGLADRFLAVSETLAHLDVLIDAGRAQAVPSGGVILFRRPG